MFKTVKIATVQRLEAKELKPVEMFEKLSVLGRYGWLEKLAVWWLRKRCLIVQHVVNDWVTTPKAEYVEIDLNDIRKSVHKQMRYLYDRYGIQPNTIFVGREIDHAIRLHITSDMVYGGSSRDEVMHWMGMQVIVVPWMDGLLLWNDDYVR